jgi:Arc/MetJ-type ribon-helix-helix transcriptional regulator
VFDKTEPQRPEPPRPSSAEPRPGPEDERIALRCNRKELQLLDSFVANGEFRSRSELMREALREFLRGRAMSGAMISGETDTVEVPVRMRRDEVATFSTYGELVANGSPLPAVLAELVRRGAFELKVTELVAAARGSVRSSAASREQLRGLRRAGAELERKGVIGR